MTKPLLELKSVTRTFGEGQAATHALVDASFSIAKGEFVSIMGASGSGKSTLLHIMGLLDKPTGGSYLFDGIHVLDLPDAELAHMRNEKMGFIFQSFHLLPRVTVLENVVLSLYYSSVPQRDWHTKAEAALEQVQLTHRLGHVPSQLSGGERQRAAIARALVNNPDVIFADEPTGNLDTKSGQLVMDLISGLHDAGHTVVLITHEMTAASFGERLIRLQDGRVVEDGPIEKRSEVFSK